MLPQIEAKNQWKIWKKGGNFFIFESFCCVPTAPKIYDTTFLYHDHNRNRRIWFLKVLIVFIITLLSAPEEDYVTSRCPPRLGTG